MHWCRDCTKASEKRRRFGAEECFFSGVRGDRQGSGRGQARTQGVVGRELEAEERHAQNERVGRNMAEDMKKGGFPRLFWFLCHFSARDCLRLVAIDALQGMGETGNPSA